MTRYTDEGRYLGDDGWGRWVQPVEKGYKLACCDCGLVHTVEFRVEDERAQFRMRRNNRSTALVRRHNSIKVRKII